MTERYVADGLRYPADGSIVAVGELALRAGHRLVVFGPNGAGKTTLLRLLAGVLPGGPALATAYLPQHPHLFRGSAGWNLGLGLDAERASWARALVERFGLDPEVLLSPARLLSGGERQRLALARVVARPEPWVLLDEPLAAFDVADRMRVAGALVEALSGRGAVIVTHDREEAAVLGEEMAVMIDGAIVQHGSVSEVFSLPLNDQVARAVGIGNVLDGTVTTGAEPLCAVDVAGIRIWGMGELSGGLPARALFGAESVTLFPGEGAAAGSARNQWPGIVLEVRPAGRLVEVLVDAGPRVAALLTPGALEALHLVRGSKVTLAVKATSVRIIPG